MKGSVYRDLNTVYTINDQNYTAVQNTLTLLENFLHLLLCFICYTNLCTKWKQDWGQGLRKLLFSDTVALQWTWMKEGTRKARAVQHTLSPWGARRRNVASVIASAIVRQSIPTREP